MEFPAEDFSRAFFAYSNDGAERLSGDFGQVDSFGPVEAKTVVLATAVGSVSVGGEDGRRRREAPSPCRVAAPEHTCRCTAQIRLLNLPVAAPTPTATFFVDAVGPPIPPKSISPPNLPLNPPQTEPG
jgi:hypothetical protein